MKEANHKAVFLEEARELLIDLEDALLELENTPDDTDLVQRIFRVMHTIKGSSAMFGFDTVAGFTHEIETFYEKVRQGDIKITPQLINVTLAARDQISELLIAPQGEVPSSLADTIAVFHSLAPLEEATNIQSLPKKSKLCDGASPLPLYNPEPATYRIRFRPAPGIFFNGTNPINLLKEIHSFGNCKVIAHTDNVPPLNSIEPDNCYISWDIILTSNRDIDAIKDVFIFVEDDSEITIEIVTSESKDKKIGEILVERGDISCETLDEILVEKKYLGEMLVEKGFASPATIESALLEQKRIREIASKKEKSSSSVRVPADKLDVLVNLVGELVTVQARLTQTASTMNDVGLGIIAEEVERLTSELRDNALNIRMLPIGTIFGRFKRLVRDLSRDLGKEIELTMEGAETELDKTVLERLTDPLVHLIRNSIDHGIEPPEKRIKDHKNRKGIIRLSAVHSGGNVIIQIEDDGKGLDKEAIRARAIERGLVSPSAELTDKDLYEFIFHSGFSTADEVTNISGRGVGMDVVRKGIEALRGSIDITSEKDRGTLVTVVLPLTLAIVEGLLVVIGGKHFILPLSLVEECMELTRSDILKANGKDIAYIRGEILPYVHLRKEFSIPGDSPQIQQIVITSHNGNRIGFVVDNVIGEHQTVIKSLGKFYKDVDGISGATILGDGRLALILDIPKLLKRIEKN